MAQEYKLVDPFVSLPEPPQGEHRQLDPNIARWFRHSKALLAGATIDDMIADMDEAGIETAILTARFLDYAYCAVGTLPASQTATARNALGTASQGFCGA